MKLTLLMVVVLLALPGCSFDADDISHLIDEHVKDMEEYEAEYTLTENGQKFKVIESYQDSGNYHKIVVIFPERQKQIIERKSDEVTISFYPAEFTKKVHINDFDTPQYTYVKTVKALSSLLNHVDDTQPNVAIFGENQEGKVYFDKRSVQAIELNWGGKEYKLEFQKLIVN
ncbi:hypothetical protein PRVXT_002736 [Proteinivorax tanatarense]|uniref:Lipoprotein n=1 Tax=Proteinivorax tanatarense TaxID=1260629 RepID=A0AAU7VL29_9FIRM